MAWLVMFKGRMMDLGLSDGPASTDTLMAWLMMFNGTVVDVWLSVGPESTDTTKYMVG